MKKILGFLALACVLMTAGGCGSKNSGAGGTDHFKEYSFTKEVSEDQKARINDGLEKSLDSLSSISAKYEYYTKNNSSNSKLLAEGTLKVCEDSSKPQQLIINYTVSSTNYSTSDGITLNSKIKMQKKSWDGGRGYAVSATTTTNNGVTTDEYDADEIIVSSKEYKDSAIKQNVSFPSSSNLEYYQNSDGSFTAIYSEVDKDVSGVQWGNETREHISENKEQTVYKITKDYRLKSYYTYEEHSSNRDPSTDEWYSSVQVYARYYTSIEYTYGKRESSSIDKLNSSISGREIPLGATLKEINSRHSESNYSVLSESEGESISYTYTTGSDGTKTYRFLANSPDGYDGEYYYGKRFVLDITSLRSGTSLVHKEIKLDVTSETNISYEVSNYYYSYKTTNDSYFINTSSYTYNRLQIYFVVVNNSQANITSVSIY